MAVKVIAQKGPQMDAFTFCVNELALVSGKDFQTVLEHEVARILELAIGRTKKSDPGKVLAYMNKQKMTRQDIDYRGPQSTTGRTISPSEQARLRLRANQRRGNERGGLLYSLPAGYQHRHPQWLWNELKRRRQERTKERLEKIGLAAKHWLEIARVLGLPINAPGEVARAKNSYKMAVKAHKGGKGKEFVIEGGNFSKLSTRHARGHQALASAVRSRVTSFNAAMKQRGKGKVDAVTKKYPQLLKAA